MAFSVFSIAAVPSYAEGSSTDAHLNALADALRSDNVKNATFSGTNTVTVSDTTGDVAKAAQAYYAVFCDYAHVSTGGSQNEYNNGYRTSSQVRDAIKNAIQSRMGTDYGAYGAAGVLNYLGGNQTVSASNNTNQNSVSVPTIKVTVTQLDSLTRYATLDEIENAATYSYQISHARRSYSVTSGSGCSQTTTTYYYAAISGRSDGYATTGVDISALRAFETALADNADVIAADLTGKIALGYDALAASFNGLDTARAGAVNAFGKLVANHFFPTADDDIAAVEAAMKIAQFAPIVGRINDYVATDISAFDLAALTEIYENLKADYNSYKAINIDEVYAYFEIDNQILSRDAVDAKYEEIENAYQIAYLRENVKPVIDADLATFATYDDDFVLATDNADVPVSAAITAINGYVNTLAQYKQPNVDVVFGEGFVTNTFDPERARLNKLLEVNELKLRFEAFKTVYTQAFEPVTPEYTTDQLYAVLNARDGWYTDLQAYVAELKAYDEVLAGKILTDLEAAMEAKIDAVYAMLNDRVEATINNAYDLYQGFVAEYGYTIDTADDVSVGNYTALRAAIGLLNPDHYTFLKERTAHFDIDPATVAKYDEIQAAVFAFVNFDASKGLTAYKYNHAEIADIIREVSVKDVSRNKDYVVTDEKVDAIIDILENLLASDQIKDALGMDLAETVSGVLDNLYTDDFLNTLVQYVYPMVTKEFAKVWADLPATTHVDDPVSVDISLKLDNLPTALSKMGIELLPKLLAGNVGAYPEVAAALNAVPNTATVDKEADEWIVNPWENENIYDAETGKLTLAWGITDKESFLNAASAALSGLEELLLALLANKTTEIGPVKVGTGSGSYCIASITVDPINLFMNFGGNPGYNNMLAPILVALGAESVPNGNTLDSTRKLLENGLIEPLEGVLDKFAAAPLDFILKALPNLAFALHMGLVEPLFSQLKTSIAYHADAHYTVSVGADPGDIKNAIADALDVNIGEMLDISSLGIDFSSLNGLLNSIIGLLTKPDEEPAEGEEPAAPALTLPAIDEEKLSMLGTDVEWIPGYRTASPFAGVEGHGSDYARIVVGNRADVFMAVLDYLMRGIRDNDLLNSILDFINSSKAEDEAKVELSESIQTIIDNVIANNPDSIAAVVELIFPQRYDMPEKINWITEGNIEQEDYDYWDEYAASVGQSFWTKDKAEYLQAHLEDFTDDVITLFSENLGGAENLGDAVNYLLANLYKADTLNSLAGSLKDLVGGIELPEAIANMGLLEQIGLDLNAWDNMSFSFADGDKAAFKAGLIEILKPLTPVLNFILAEKDIELTLLDSINVKALGYDGYSYGLIPLLEAVGADGIKTPAELQADSENIVKNIIDPVFSLLDKLGDDPLVFIEDVLPGLLYFDKVGGVQVAVNHLLTAVNVLLDTIRPIYDINLYALAEEKLGFDLRFAETDPINFLLSKIGDVIAESGIPIELDFTVESLSEKLHFTDPIKFTSKNGDEAYTIRLSEEGKADLLTTVLDYVVEDIAFGDNIDAIMKYIEENMGLSEGIRAFIGSLLKTLKHVEADQPGTGKAILFWIFFGADSITDASADFFVRYEDMDYKGIVISMLSSTADYIARAGFVMKEAYHDYSIAEYNVLTAMEEAAPAATQAVGREFGAMYQFVQMLRKMVLLIRNTFKTIFGIA